MQRNLAIPKKHHIRKKVRGSKRRLSSLERKLDSILLSIPEQSLPHDKSWQYHVPSPNKLVDSTDSSYKLRKKFLKMLSVKLLELDKSINGKYKTLLFLSLPYLSRSRIDICVDSKNFERLTDNADAPSSWLPVTSKRNVIDEYDLPLPAEYRAKGYFRHSADLKDVSEENWIIWKAK